MIPNIGLFSSFSFFLCSKYLCLLHFMVSLLALGTTLTAAVDATQLLPGFPDPVSTSDPKNFLCTTAHWHRHSQHHFHQPTPEASLSSPSDRWASQSWKDNTLDLLLGEKNSMHTGRIKFLLSTAAEIGNGLLCTHEKGYFSELCMSVQR